MAGALKREADFRREIRKLRRELAEHRSLPAKVEELKRENAQLRLTLGGPEQLAQRFHETYERLAPHYGYETRKESAVPWDKVPEQNRQLMIAVCESIISCNA